MSRLTVLVWAACVAALSLHAASPKAATPGGIDFNREIRPILSDNCFACHGPDDKTRKGKLRLDIKEEALKPGKSGALAIVPGAPDKSEVVARIKPKDEDDLMPPEKSGKKLSQQQIDLLTRWIKEGAPWQEHWAFSAPKRPTAPAVKNSKWVKNDVDKFVLAKLETEKLKPSPETDKTTLLRRATLDVTGLPPTPQEVDAFLADKSPEAYEKLVDRLLAAPAYGEHMARQWLDGARYADSHGYHIDSERAIWKYRDWVIDAFNTNMPYDQFTVEQLAGDMLPGATEKQKIASGYLRCNMSTGEGGAINEEYQAKYAFDRLETTSTLWLGLTMSCARCHTHKYDPIQHKEYFGLYAFFNNLNEAVMDGNKPNPDPFIKVPSEEQKRRTAELTKLIADGQAKLDAPMPELDAKQPAWEAKWRSKLSDGWTVLKPESVTATNGTNGTKFTIADDGAVLVSGENPPQDVHELTLPLPEGSLAGFRLEALPHESLPQKSAARADDGGFRLSEFESEIIYPDKEGKAGKPSKVKFKEAIADSARDQNEAAKAIDGKPETGWQAEGLTDPHAALFLPAEALSIKSNATLRVRLRYQASQSKRAIGHFRLSAAQDADLAGLLAPPKPEPWQVVGPFKTESTAAGFTNVYEPEQTVDLKQKFQGVREEIRWNAKPDFADGKENLLVQDLHGIHGAYYLYRTIKAAADRTVDISVRADDLFKIWVNGKLVAERGTKGSEREGALKVPVKLAKGENKILLKVVTTQGAAYFSFKTDLNDTLPADVAALFAATKKFNAAQEKKIRIVYRRLSSPEYKQTADSVEKWREESAAIDRAIPTTLIAKELDKPRDTFILMRGEYDKPGAKVTAGLPAILPPLPAGLPTNRLGLAKWLVDTNHPLTARVTVNRLWNQFFGVGLVKTAEDFGVQGEPPSHPELMDWLATEFMQSGWNVKKLQRLLLLSATYRQSSKVTPELLARDPENRLLARGPRFRVDAETVRDSALAVSGLLVDKIGGRSVKPYEPPGLWEAVSFNNSQKYVPEKGEGQYRRSLYTYWKRQSPPPNMLLFDAPTREYCVVRRPRTNTPLQALALLNDPQFVEASRALGHRMLCEGGDSVEGRLAYGFRLATSRKPTKDETRVLLELYQQELKAFQADQDAASKLLSVGTFKARENVNTAELAACTTVANMILNLDEAVTKN